MNYFWHANFQAEMSGHPQILTFIATLLSALLMNTIMLPAQVPVGFHPRHCLHQDDFIAQTLENDFSDEEYFGINHIPGGTGAAPYFIQLTKDKESGELKASCATPEIDSEVPKIRRQSKADEAQRTNSGVTLIPNPAKDVVIIRNGYQSAVFIFDYTGRQVLFRQLGSDTKLDISALNCGIYSVKVEKGNMMVNLQLMIQR